MIKRVLLVSVFLTLPTLAFGAAYEVHTWGYGDLMFNVIKAIKILIGSGSYQRMAQIALLIGALVAVLSLMNAKDFSVYMVAQKIIAGILLYTFIIATPHDMIIRDHVNTKNAIQHIDKVPAMIGFPLMLFSNLERGASEIFRTSLASTPGALTGIGSVPVVTGYDLLYTTSNYRIQDPNFNRTMNEFVQNCVYPDVLTGFIDIADLASSDTFWSRLNNTHPARISGIFKAGASGIDGDLQPCPQVYDYINTTLNNYVAPNGTASKQLAGALGYLSSDSVSTIIGAVSKQTFEYQQTGQNFMRNAIAMNSFNDAYVQTAHQVGMDPSGIAYGMAKGAETSATQMTLSGIMAKKYMPISKGFMTVIMVALIPLIVLIGLATNSIRKPIGMIVGILTALSLWAIGSQLLDFFIMIRTKSLMAGVTDVGGAYSIMTKPIVEQGILDSINMAMSMYWMIPTLSFAVASMSGYSASQMMSGVGATANSSIGGASGEVATGSQSMGVVRNNMISMNKYDGVSSLRGGHTTQLSNLDSVAGKNDKELTTDNKVSDVDSYKQHTDIDTQNKSLSGNKNIHQEHDINSNQKVNEKISRNENSQLNLAQDVDKNLYERGNTHIDRDTKDTRDVNKSGSEMLAGDKTTVDNTNSLLTGDISRTFSNLKTYEGGSNMTGYQSSSQALEAGASVLLLDPQMRKSFEENRTQELNSLVQSTGQTKHSEQQAAKAFVEASVGGSVPFFSAKAGAEVSTNISRVSENTDSKSLHRMVIKGIDDTIMEKFQNGDYTRADGTVDYNAMNQELHEKHDAYYNYVENQMMNNPTGIGSGFSNAKDAVIDKGKEVAGAVGDGLNDIGERAKAQNNRTYKTD